MSTNWGLRRALAAVACGLVLAGAGPARGEEWGPGKFMTQAVARVMGAAKGISDLTDYGYDDGICVMAAFLRPKATVGFDRPLVGGEEYLILGGGDEDVEDLDIEVFGPGGAKVAEDTRTDAAPLVRFTAPQNGQYKIRLKLYKASQGSFCMVAVLRKGGFTVPVRNLAEATVSLMGRCGALNTMMAGEASFHDEDNQWAVYGTILRQGQEVTITRMALGEGRKIVLAAGDRGALDIDLFILDEEGRVKVKDEDEDANPVCDIRVRGNPLGGLRIKNVRSNGPTLVLSAILKVKE